MKKSKAEFRRPKTAKQVAENSASLEDFGYNLRDWQHELRLITSRPELEKSLAEPPPLLQTRFTDGSIADAYVSGYCGLLADHAGIPRPDWTDEPDRTAPEPWFSSDDRARLLVTTPAQLREKNIFTEPEIPFQIKRGRPRKSLAEKKRANAERQKRYRLRRNKELEELRALKAKGLIS